MKTSSIKKISITAFLSFFLILDFTTGFSQIVKLDTSELETTMRNPMTFDRAQYIPQWLLLGNIPAKWNEGLDKDFLSGIGGEANIRPQEGQSVNLSNGKELKWKVLQNPAKFIDLAEFFKSNLSNSQIDNIVRYGFGIINRKKPGKALLTIGSDGAIKVWLNGKLVHRNTLFRATEIDQDLIEVNLNQGDNYLLIKTVQSAWGRSFTARVTEDANIPENTVQKIQLTLNDDPKTTTLNIKSSSIFHAITKQQSLRLNIYTAGGKSVFDKTMMRGDSITLNYSTWDEGPYEIKYMYTNLHALSCTEYVNWFKGDALKTAQDLVKTAPEKKAGTPEEVTHRMLADFVNYRIAGDFKTTDQYKISLLHPLLMEFAEMKAKNQIRPGGFIRLAYVDDIDGTPQFCRCFIPPGYDPSKKSAMIVFLHGMSQENSDYVHWWAYDKRHDANVDRYNFILIEPHGRGNTEYIGIGDRDVMKCIQMAKEKLNIDEDRVYLTGVSMGGSGTWRVASLHPEIFAAIAPVFGGWDYRNTMKKEDLKLLSKTEDFILDKDHSTCQFESLLNTPILALHGDNDKNVDVENTRYLVRMLERWGYDIRYIEVPGKGHENLEMDDVIYPWLLKHTHNKSPKQVRIRAAELRTASAYWVKVTQRNKPLQMINVQAEILANNIIQVNSDNVMEMVLSPAETLLQRAQPVNIIWNGEIYTFDNLTNHTFTLQSKELVTQKLHKTPALAGPISDFTNTPFALVVGTISKDSVMQNVIQQKTDAFVYFWLNWQKFKPRVFKDTEISDSMLKNYSLLLIGGPKENKISQRIIKSFPLEIKSSTIAVGGRVIQAPDAVLDAIYPSPFNAARYIRLLAPTSYQGMYLYDIYNQEILNFDYTITDGKISNPAIRDPENKIGVATGFFDHNWKVDTGLLTVNTNTNTARRTVDKDLNVNIIAAALPSPDMLNTYIGTYKMGKMDMVIKVMLLNNKLLIQEQNQGPMETTAISTSEFLVNGTNILLSFQKDGHNEYFTVYQSSNRMKCIKVGQ